MIKKRSILLTGLLCLVMLCTTACDSGGNETVCDEFVRGVDISSYISEKEAGVIYKNFDGEELSDEEFFHFLARCGVNWVRIRVWNHPYDREGNGYGGGNCDIEKALTIGRYATDAGMQVLIDFHYSDFWADPGKQFAPKAWENKSLDEKKTFIADYTTESLNKLLNAGVDVQMVQIGNEINSGVAGETKETHVYSLLASASAAVRGVSKSIKIAVHYANPEKEGFTTFASKLNAAGLDYDVFGISYYPFWHGTLDNLTNVMNTIQTEHGKQVMVMETSYAYTYGDGDAFSNSIGEGTEGASFPYEVSVQGQADAVRNVMECVYREGGLGVFYWEPAWIPVNVWTENAGNANQIYQMNKAAWEKYGCGWASSFSKEYDPKDAGVWYGGSSWDNQAMFDFEGNPLESLKVFQSVFDETRDTIE